MPMRVVLVLCLVGALARSAAAAATGAGLFVAGAPLPVVESTIDVEVRLGVAHGTVQQRFHNDRAAAVEAVYVFPLPATASIESMEATVGGATVRAAIARRAEAAAAYQDAVNRGRAAALVEVERPGVFTQSLAPVPPGGDVVVTLRWRATLERRDGVWELAHPLVVGPRFVPGAATGRPTLGSGGAVDTDRAPDASRVTPPTAPGASTPFRVAVRLDDATAVASPTHPYALERGVVTVDDLRGDRELVLRWRSARDEQVRAVAEPAGGGAYVAVLIEPAAAAPAVRGARSWVIAVDGSPSLRGAGAAAARAAAHALVDAIPAGDRLAVTTLGRAPVAVTRADAAAAIDELPEGSADLTRALTATLARVPRDPTVAVVVITDGLVADDAAAIERAAAAGVTIHTVGVGAAPNRWLLDAIARRSGGSSRVVASIDDVPVIARAMVAADRAVPLAIDWRRPGVIDAELTAARVAPGQAALVVAVVPSGVPDGEVEVTVGARVVRVRLERVSAANLAATWAALRVQRLYAAGDREAATLLALERGVVAPGTSLVATTTRADEPVRSVIAVPVPLPAGTRRDAVREEEDRRSNRGGDEGGGTEDGDADDEVPLDFRGVDPTSAPPAAEVGVAGGGTAEAPGRAYAAAMEPASDGSVLARALDRHFVTASLGFGVRLDARAPAAQLSLASYWRLPRFYAVGARLDVGAGAAKDDPVVAAGLATLATSGRLPLRLDVGVGLGYAGGLGVAYDVGLLFGRNGLGLVLRLTGVAAAPTEATTVSVGAEAAF